jgi:hypothetical protein
VCELADRRRGVPDEGSMWVHVTVSGLDCSVQLLDGEWRDQAPRTWASIRAAIARED